MDEPINDLSANEVIIEDLQHLMELTKNEARVYSLLLKEQYFDPQEISIKLNLPRSRVYETLSKLAAKNLLFKNPEGFGYRVIPPKEAVEKMTEEIKENFTNKEHALSRFGNYLQNIWEENIVTEISPGIEIRNFKETEQIFNEDIIKSRERVLIAAASNNSAVNWKNSGESLSQLNFEKQDIRYLVNSKTLYDRVRLAFQRFMPFSQKHIENKIRYNEQLFLSYVIIDQITYLFFFGNNKSYDPITLRTGNPGVTDSFLWQFNRLWDEGNNSI